MAQLVLGVAGAAIGSMFGAPQLGWAIGSAIGGFAQQSSQKSYGPRLSDLKVTGVDYGQPIPWVRGMPRVAGQIWWASDRREIASTESAGKGGGPSVTTYTYEVDLLIGLTDGELGWISRIWWNGKLIYNVSDAAAAADVNASTLSEYWRRLTIYTGAEDQLPDPTYEAALGAGLAPAYRGRGTVFIEGLQLGNSGQLPNLTFEIALGSLPQGETVLLMQMDDNIVDEVGHAFSADVEEGILTYDTGRFGRAVRVSSTAPSGGGSNIIYSDDGSIDWDLNGGDFTIEGRMLFTDLPSGTSCYMIRVADDVSGFDEYQLLYSVGTGAFLATYPNGTSSSAQIFQGGAIGAEDLNQWIHIALTREGDTYRFFVNGAMATGSFSYRRGAGAKRVFIGNVIRGFMGDFYGLIDAVRIVKGAAIYVAPFTPPASPPGFTATLGVTTPLPTLQSVVEDLCERAGLESGQVDATALASITRPVRAMAASVVGPVRPLLEQLQAAYFFEKALSDKIYFFPRAGDPVAVIPYDDLAAGLENAAEHPLALTVANDLEISAQVAVQYANADDDQQPGVEYSDRLISGQASLNTVQLALALTPAEAKGVADAIRADNAASMVGASLSLPLPYARLQPSDVVLVLDDPNGMAYRLRLGNKQEQQGVATFQAVLDDASVVESASITDENYVPSSSVSVLSATVLRPLDMPLMRDEDDGPGYYVAARGETSTWPGATVLSAPAGADYASVASIGEAAVLGTSTEALGDAPDLLIMDERNALTVSVGAGELSSTTREALLADKTVNAMLVGNEVVRFVNAELLSTEPNIFKLTRLLRGQAGTEWASSGHVVGERVVLLRPQGLRRVSQQVSEIGQLRNLKGVTYGASPANALVQQFTPMSVSQKPLSPVGVRVGSNYLNGDLQITWHRRTRFSARFASPSGISAPLGERTEAYSVDIFSDSDRTVLLRTASASSQSLLYTAADQVSDTGALVTELYVTVYQLSDTVGRGYGGNGQIAGIAFAPARSIVYDDQASVLQSFLDTRVDGAVLYKAFTPAGLGEPNTWLLGDASSNAVEIMSSSTGWKQLAMGSTDRIRITGTGLSFNASVGYRSGYGNIAAFLPAEAGVFERLEWTGNGAGARAIPHAIGEAPALAFVKSNALAKWWMYSSEAGAGQSMRFPEATLAGDVFSADANAFPSLSTDTDLEVGSDLNANGVSYLAFVFSGSSAGVDSGTYTGNGTGAGPATALGYKPEILIIRNIDGSAARTFITMAALDGTAATHWFIDDAGTSPASTAIVSLSDTGFQPVSTDVAVNESGTIYQYWALKP